MNECEQPARLLRALRSGEPVLRIHFRALHRRAGGRAPDLLPAPYDSPREAWRRLNA
jgi:hypothetical protein